MIDLITANTYSIQNTVNVANKVANDKKNFDLQRLNKEETTIKKTDISQVTGIKKSETESVINENKEHIKETKKEEQKQSSKDHKEGKKDFFKKNDNNKKIEKHIKSDEHLIDTVA